MAEVLYSKKDGSISYQKLARETSMPVNLVSEILNVHSPLQIGPRALAQVRQFPRKVLTDAPTDNELERAM